MGEGVLAMIGTNDDDFFLIQGQVVGKGDDRNNLRRVLDYLPLLSLSLIHTRCCHLPFCCEVILVSWLVFQNDRLNSK